MPIDHNCHWMKVTYIWDQEMFNVCVFQTFFSKTIKTMNHNDSLLYLTWVWIEWMFTRVVCLSFFITDCFKWTDTCLCMRLFHRYLIVLNELIHVPVCACSTGVNLLIGTENGLMLLDRSGQGKGWKLFSLDMDISFSKKKDSKF